MPVPLLLLAKLVAVSFLLSTVDRMMPAPFLPFLAPLDAFAGSSEFAAAWIDTALDARGCQRVARTLQPPRPFAGAESS